MIRVCVFLLVLMPGLLAAFPLPPPLETAHFLGKGRPAGQAPIPLEDEFYALGWSRASAFAFLERRTVNSQEKILRLRILDLVEDKVLWEQQWPDWGDASEDWWTAHEPEVDRLFGRFELVPTQLQMGFFPLILGEEFYTLTLRQIKNSADPSWVSDLEIGVNSTGRGLKTVSVGSGFWRWATLLGFVPSPFEGRVALITLVQPAGWMNQEQPIRFLVSGLSLKAGFSKP